MIGRPRKAWPFVTLELVTGGALGAMLLCVDAPLWTIPMGVALIVVSNLSGWHEGQVLERERPIGTMTAGDLAERIKRGERWAVMARRTD